MLIRSLLMIQFVYYVIDLLSCHESLIEVIAGNCICIIFEASLLKAGTRQHCTCQMQITGQQRAEEFPSILLMIDFLLTSRVSLSF
jgi:hypothetical protein